MTNNWKLACGIKPSTQKIGIKTPDVAASGVLFCVRYGTYFLLSNDIIAYVKMICNMHIMRIIFAVSILVFWVSSNSVTVQPCISYIHKPASELSVAALQLLFISFQK